MAVSRVDNGEKSWVPSVSEPGKLCAADFSQSDLMAGLGTSLLLAWEPDIQEIHSRSLHVPNLGSGALVLDPTEQGHQLVRIPGSLL